MRFLEGVGGQGQSAETKAISKVRILGFFLSKKIYFAFLSTENLGA